MALSQELHPDILPGLTPLHQQRAVIAVGFAIRPTDWRQLLPVPTDVVTATHGFTPVIQHADLRVWTVIVMAGI